MTAILPVEILDHIFSFLRNDFRSLTACMSVNPCFQAIGQKHLWYHYSLHNFPGVASKPQLAGTPAQLSKVLADTPGLATYIRSLEITIVAPSILQWFMSRSLNVEEIAPLLPVLCYLQRLSVVGRWISWERLDEEFQAALVRTLSLPSVEEVAIEGMERLPLSLFNRCTGLKRLSFTGCHFVPELDSRLEVLQTGTRPVLDSFTVRDTHIWLLTVIDWLCDSDASPDITHLRSLNITIDSVPQLCYVADLLQICSTSLRELELTPSEAVNLQYDVNSGHSVIPLEYITPPPLGLPKMNELRSLTLTGEIWTSDGFWVSSDGQDELAKNTYSTPLSWICRLLESPPPALTHLTLELVFKVVYPSNLKWIRWDELARALAAPNLRTLKRVDLLVSFQTTGNASRVIDMALGVFRNDEHLSELIKRGLLSIQSRTKKDEVSVRL